MEAVIEKIRSALEKNGFPEKMVRLPFQPVYKSCKNSGTTLSAVLNELKSSDILNEMDSDKILFYHKSHPPRKKEDATDTTKTSKQGIPDELYAETMEKIKNMDPTEVEKIREQIMAMSDEDRAELMKQAQQILQNREN